MVRNSPARAGDTRDPGLIPVFKILWRKAWQPTPLFLPGESHGQKSLVGFNPWGCKRVGHNLATKQQQHTELKPHWNGLI